MVVPGAGCRVRLVVPGAGCRVRRACFPVLPLPHWLRP